jgi:hypothetical protein
MVENFEKAFEFLMKYEGYKSNHKNDPGGRTIYGISERYHPGVVKKLWDLPKDVALEEAKIFYKREYWNKIDGDDIQDKVDILLFDISVNPGMRLINIIKKKFIILEWESLKELKIKGWTLQLIEIITLLRIKYYNDRVKANPKMKVFLHGWLNRCFDLMEYLK